MYLNFPIHIYITLFIRRDNKPCSIKDQIISYRELSREYFMPELK